MILVSVLLYFTKQTSLKTNILAGLILTTVIWIVDSYVIFLRRPKSLRLGNELLIDNMPVSPKDIEDIRKITYKPGRFWTWEYFVFTIKSGENIKSINIIEKPQTLIEFLLNKKSKTLAPLFSKYPELKNKFTHQTTISSIR
jgi:hypothetical protein